MARRSKTTRVEDSEADVTPEDSELEEDLDVPNSDDDVDYDDNFDDLESEGSSSGRSRASSIDDLKAIEPEVALRANPKRGQSQRKEARPLDGVKSISELEDPATALKIWKKFEKSFAKRKAKAYKVSDDYSLDDIIEHPTFGKGYVVEILSNTKFVILFSDGIRRLMYNIGKK